jgi:uncharacterized protein
VVTQTNTTLPLTSAIYEGKTWHQRRTPFVRSFSMKMWMAYLNLDEVSTLHEHVFVSHSRFRPLRFDRSDYLGDPHIPLSDAVREVVRDKTGEQFEGTIYMLSQLRTWGWCFNPLSLYYCFDDSATLRWVVAEVTNTPWKEREIYVLPADTEGVIGHVEHKRLHVSPLWPMTQDYSFTLSAPSEQLAVRIDNIATEGDNVGEIVHVAGLTLHRLPLNNKNLARLLIVRPLLTHRVTAAIHRHAVILMARGARFHSHPKRRRKEPTS